MGIFSRQKFKILYFCFRLLCFCYRMESHKGKELSICFESSKKWLPVNLKIIFFLQPCFTNNCKPARFPDKSIAFCFIGAANGWLTYCIIPTVLAIKFIVESFFDLPKFSRFHEQIVTWAKRA